MVSEILIVININITELWNVTTCSYKSFGGICCFHLLGRRDIYPEDGGRVFLPSVRTSLPTYTASHPRKSYLQKFLLWNRKIYQCDDGSLPLESLLWASLVQYTSLNHLPLEVHFNVMFATTPRPCWHSFRILSYVRTIASSKASSPHLRLFPRLPVTSVLPSILQSGVLEGSSYAIQITFLLFNVRRVFIFSLTVYNTSSFLTRSVQKMFSIFSSTTFQNSQVFLICFPKCPSFSTYKATPQM